MRRDYELYANLRPVRVFAGTGRRVVAAPEIVRGLDLLVVRELTGGIYYGKPKEQRRVDGVDEAVDTMIYRAPEIERIARIAFELRARAPQAPHLGRQAKHPGNVAALAARRQRGGARVSRRAARPPARRQRRDAARASPRCFDVIVTENMFGDILSDEAAILTGSIGTLPSASLGTRGAPGRQFGLYEPIGGTAPDLAGKNVANPTAAILSAAMLLRHSLGDDENAARIERAVERAYADGLRTAELVRDGSAPVSTQAFTDGVVARLPAAGGA